MQIQWTTMSNIYLIINDLSYSNQSVPTFWELELQYKFNFRDGRYSQLQLSNLFSALANY